MRAPKERRSLEEIMDEAVEVIAPPAEARDLCRKKVADNVRWLQNPYKVVHRRELIRAVDRYTRALRKVRTARAAADMAGYVSAEKFERVAEELKYAEGFAEDFRGLPAKKGGGIEDWHAKIVVEAARDLLDPDPFREQVWFGGSEFPYDDEYLKYECPWRDKPTLYIDGKWHRLSVLLYEAITGRVRSDLKRYCIKSAARSAAS
jgi:hypothetical protein